MRQSEKIDQIAAALLKVQGSLKPAAKSRVNPHLKNHYATLADVWDACRDALQSNGVSVFQTAEAADDNAITVVTLLCHVSGQFLGGEFRMPLDKSTAQAAGSAITYGRRYGLAAALGIVNDDDDDGHAASQRSAPAPQRAPAPRQASAPAPAPAARNGQDWSVLPFGKSKGTPNKDLTDDQLVSAYNWAGEKNKYTQWQVEALAEIRRRGLDPNGEY